MSRLCFLAAAVVALALGAGPSLAAEAPPPEAPPGCQGEGCRGSGTVPATVPGAGSAGFEAPGPLGLFGATKVRGSRAPLRAIVPAAGRLTVTGNGLVAVETAVSAAGSLPLALVLAPPAQRKLRRKGVFHSAVEAIFIAANGDASRADLVLRFDAPAGRGKGR
ncbi:MAG TPA: hypothetical protein VMS11_09845 [Solirubrobacterales bacterium]|nr:hypothetical protein [Solirubrobacterales bacterium]